MKAKNEVVPCVCRVRSRVDGQAGQHNEAPRRTRGPHYCDARHAPETSRRPHTCPPTPRQKKPYDVTWITILSKIEGPIPQICEISGNTLRIDDLLVTSTCKQKGVDPRPDPRPPAGGTSFPAIMRAPWQNSDDAAMLECALGD